MTFESFTASERKVLARLNTPAKIQDYLDSLPMNFSDQDPCLSVHGVLSKRTAHCMEGALLAAAALWFHGRLPLLLDLTTTPHDEDHVVAVFTEGLGSNKRYGAISKTNHAVLRFREPVYKSVSELAMSYFHEYFLFSGEKTLRTYSTKPFDLSRPAIAKLNWLTSQDGLMELIERMASAPHSEILTKQQIKNLRKAGRIEVQAGKLTVDRRRG